MPTTTAPTSSPNRGGGSRLVKWIKSMGITGGGDPEGDVGAYADLARGDCADVFGVAAESFTRVGATLYQGAAYACLAAFEGRSSGWAAAERRYQDLLAEKPRLDCLGKVTFAMLRDLVEAHRADASARFTRTGKGSARDPRCPRLLRLEPDHGPIEGGIEVRVIGVNLPAKATIQWYQSSLETTTDGRSGTVVAPALGEPGGVNVWVEGWPWAYFGTPGFTYDPP